MDPEHIPTLVLNSGGKGQHRLGCTCEKLGLVRTKKELVAAWLWHLRMTGAEWQDAPETYGDFRALARIVRAKRKPPQQKPQNIPVPLPPEALALLWDVIWPAAARGTALSARELARASHTQVPALAGRRYLAIAFSRYIPRNIPRVGVVVLAKEIGCAPGTIGLAERRLPEYVARFPELAGIAAEIERLTGTVLPAACMAAAAISPEPDTPGPDFIWDYRAIVKAVGQAVDELAVQDHLHGSPRLSKSRKALFTRALSAAAAGEIYGSALSMRRLASALGVERRTVYQSMRELQALLPDPDIAGFVERLFGMLRSKGMSLK